MMVNSSVLKFTSDRRCTHQKEKHPTQKPLALCEYLINTYTNKNEVVLDNCMGSGTTAVACIRTERQYIGFEIKQKYITMAEDRIKLAKGKVGLFE